MARTERILIQVEGMHCASCASRVERSLSAVSGVEEVNVNLASNKAAIRYDPGRVETRKLILAIEQAGYEAPVRKAAFSVGGIHCASCAAKVERALKGLPGVLDAGVNLATEKATVEYLPGEAL